MVFPHFLISSQQKYIKNLINHKLFFSFMVSYKQISLVPCHQLCLSRLVNKQSNTI